MNKLIKEIRLTAQMSQEQFANALGTTPLSVNRWENGKTMPNNMAQLQLFEFCKVRNIDLFEYVVNKVKYNGENPFILYHGSKKGIVGNVSPISSSYCDFGKGFYMGTDPAQPLTLICDEKSPKFYSVAVDLPGLKVLNVEVGLDWALMIAYYRGYMKAYEGTAICNKYAHMADGYDMIVGYIANDRMYKVMTRFFEKEITDEALLNSLSVLDLGKQYVAINQKACDRVKVLTETSLNKLELKILENKSIKRREEGITLTEEILVKYRRKGKYFDEIMRGE